MKVSSFVGGLAALPSVLAWGGFGHITVAYVAGNFVTRDTEAFFQNILRDDSGDYLASVASWADSIRYTHWGRFTEGFHFIDAQDSPPDSCSVEYQRDCKRNGCVISAMQNYTSRLLDASLPSYEREQAAKFVIHFVGDAHQPLHDEEVARGGNSIHVDFDGARVNLHHVWDTSIPEKIVGHVSRHPFGEAKRWADKLTDEINSGKFHAASQGWLSGMDLADPESTTLVWARESNAYVCSTVMPEGPDAIKGQELGGDYFETAAPVVEIQIARAGYRLGAWLNLIAQSANQQQHSMNYQQSSLHQQVVSDL